MPGVPEVSGDELAGALKRLRAKRTAPDPVGIHGCAWLVAANTLGDRLRRLFTACLERGEFPTEWKRGRLVLLKE